MSRRITVKLKKLINAFGGVVLYMDKRMLNYLKVQGKDEVQIEFKDGKLIISRPVITNERVDQLLKQVKKD